ncbi:MAG: PTS sugar transporter subunit IIA [Planctomyces sp.]|nr:PTS sugar transporter subunit IIA [Planctomyces sp.]
MAHDWLTLDELSRHLGRDRRELERLVNRGRIPAHKRGSDWQFHSAEITEWLEQEMREYSESQLAAFEQSPATTGGEQSQGLLARLMPLELMQVPLDARTRRSVLESLVETAGRTWKIWEPAAVLKAVMDREALMSTAFDVGVAIPHPRQPLPDSLEDSVVAFGRTLSPIPFGAPNNSGTDLFFLVLCRDARTHLQVLARVGRLIQNPRFLEELRECGDSASARACIAEAEAAIPLG